jgi:hypothetical protein
VRFHRPLIYQAEVADGGIGAEASEKEAVEGRWVMKGGNRVGFEVGTYDRRKTLVIDPALSYSTYLGGAESDYGTSVAVDASGNAFVIGTTGSIDFPTKNPLQRNNNGNSDAFVAKLNPAGTAFVYCTYLGGRGTEWAAWVTVDSAGEVVVAGRTGAKDFPTIVGSYQTVNHGHTNGFVSELNATGSALVFSTYLGGSIDDQINAVILDSSRNVYVVGWTQSTDFPTTTGAFQKTYAGHTDGFVTELNSSGSALVFSTFLGGGTNDNRAFAIARDGPGNAYVVGYTSSKTFPTTTGGFQRTYGGGGNDGFITELNPTGTALVYSTYLGGTGRDYVWSVALDSAGGTYFVGQSDSPNYPVTAGVLQPTCPGSCSAPHAIVGKFNPLGSALSYSTFLGGSGEEEGYAMAIDAAGDVYVTGRSNSVDFPITPGAFQPIKSANFDAFVSQINPTGTALMYSSFIGGNSTDTGLGLATDPQGNAYAIGRTYSSNFPTTAGSVQPAFGGGLRDGWLSKFPLADIAWPQLLNFGNVALGFSSNPMVATFSNTSNVKINISSIGITGAAAADYSKTSTCGATLAVGASCTITVTFTPTAVGSRATAVDIADDAPNSPQIVSLTGTAIPPVAVLPSSLTFLPQLIFTTSAAKAVTVTNSTGGSLTFNSITVTGQFSQTNNCGTTIQNNTSCAINVFFQPTTKGTLTGVLSVSDDGPGSLQTVSLSGVGTFMTLSPSSLNFGNQAVGTTSAPQTVTLTNNGGTSVSITGISITGTNPTSFSETTTCGSTLSGQSSCAFSVTFKPQASGKASAGLTVSDNGGASPQKSSLTGNGT